MVKVYGSLKRLVCVTNMMEPINLIKNKDTVNLLGLMELFIRANFKMMLGRDTEKCILKEF